TAWKARRMSCRMGISCTSSPAADQFCELPLPGTLAGYPELLPSPLHPRARKATGVGVRCSLTPNSRWRKVHYFLMARDRTKEAMRPPRATLCRGRFRFRTLSNPLHQLFSSPSRESNSPSCGWLSATCRAPLFRRLLPNFPELAVVVPTPRDHPVRVINVD